MWQFEDPLVKVKWEHNGEQLLSPEGQIVAANKNKLNICERRSNRPEIMLPTRTVTRYRLPLPVRPCALCDSAHITA